MRTLLVPALLLSTTALADLKPFQEEAKQKFDAHLAKVLAEDVNPACGTSFKDVASDFEHYKKEDFPRNPVNSVCTTLTYALKTVCGTPAYKKAVQSKIKGLSCVMGGNATDPKDFKARFFVKDGVWTFKMDSDGSGGIEATAILKAHLDS